MCQRCCSHVRGKDSRRSPLKQQTLKQIYKPTGGGGEGEGGGGEGGGGGGGGEEEEEEEDASLLLY